MKKYLFIMMVSALMIFGNSRISAQVNCNVKLIKDLTEDTANLVLQDFSDYPISGIGCASNKEDARQIAIHDAMVKIFMYFFYMASGQHACFAEEAIATFIARLVKFGTYYSDYYYWGKSKKSKILVNGKRIKQITVNCNVEQAFVNIKAINAIANAIDAFMGFPTVFIYNPNILGNIDNLTNDEQLKIKRERTLYQSAIEQLHVNLVESKCFFTNAKVNKMYPPCKLNVLGNYNPCINDIDYDQTGNKYLDYVKCISKDGDVKPDVIFCLDSIETRLIDYDNQIWEVAYTVIGFYSNTKVEILKKISIDSCMATDRDAAIKCTSRKVFDLETIKYYVSELTTRYLQYIYKGVTLAFKICDTCMDQKMNDFISDLRNNSCFKITQDYAWNSNGKKIGRYLELQSFIANQAESKAEIERLLNENGVDLNSCELINFGSNYYIRGK